MKARGRACCLRSGPAKLLSLGNFDSAGGAGAGDISMGSAYSWSGVKEIGSRGGE